ncbi:MAG: hypothetical protein IJF54_03840 [Clostridia bacterium]|nr:hypothetical protein [Clostridia bacterium]
MTFLYIVLGIIAFITMLLIFPISIRITYDKELSVIAKYLFFKINVFPIKEKKQQKNDTKKDPLDSSVKSKGYADTFELIKGSISPILTEFRVLLSRTNVTQFDFRLIMVGDDASNLAIQYGKVCAVVYPFISFLQTLMKFRKTNVNISVDYLKKEYEFYFNSKLKVRPIFAVSSAIKIFKAISDIRKLQSDNMKG